MIRNMKALSVLVFYSVLAVSSRLSVFQASEAFNLDTSRPIVYEAPEGAGYFGYSVAIRPKAASLNSTWTVQVGAPRGREGEGAVYRCGTFGPCLAFEVDRDSKPFGGQGAYEFKEKKDAAWIGVAMDIKSFGSYETSVVCGHRWMNQNLKNPENIDVTYLVTGVCYQQNLFNGTFELPVRRLLPLVNKDKIYTPKPYVVDSSTYHWGLGQAGISVKLALDSGDPMLMGAPGVTHWVGSVVRYQGDSAPSVGNFARTEVSRRSRYPYLGYSVAWGRFYKDGELWYVAGAPRSGNYRGEAFTFQLEGSSGDVRIRSNLVGATFGEYFGASMAASDFNGDGCDDLVVGAPLFSSKDADEGRIYVHLGTRRGNFLVAGQVINGRVAHGRFGSCVASIGDLDKDGCDDVAVGAPYEDDKKGAVYIFRGFSGGVETDFSQRILAQEVHPHLRGFGVSISSGVDVDGNKFVDIAVGSYLSGHVVLVRSRPVISLHPRVKTEEVSLIDRRAHHVNVTVCSRYAGTSAPDFVDVVRVIDVDPLRGRGRLQPAATPHRQIIRLRANQILCEIHSVLLNTSGKDFSPLQITVKMKIKPCSNGQGRSVLIKGGAAREEDDFPKGCPLGPKAEASLEIPFAGVCGPDLTCRSDLELSCKVPEFRGGAHVVGSAEYLVLRVAVKNRGEPAQNTKIKIWSNLKLRHGRSKASQDATGNIFWLDRGAILAENHHQVDFPFRIDLDEVSTHQGPQIHLNLTVEIFTSSLETNLENNICRLSVALQSDADLSFFASSSLDTAYLTKPGDGGPRTLNVTHYFEVQKRGVTPIKDVQLTIHVPLHPREDLLTFQVETAEWMDVSLQSQRSTPAGSDLRLLGGSDSMESRPPANRTLFLDCSGEGGGRCEELAVFFTRGVPDDLSSYVKIIISLNVTALGAIKTEKDIVCISTTGVLQFWKLLQKQPETLVRSASTSLYDEDRPSQVDARIVALSVFAGGLLLSFIVTLLAKKNFFKRSKRLELEALRDAETSILYFGTDLVDTREGD